MSKSASTPSFAEKRTRQKADKLVRTADSALASGKVTDALSAAQQALALLSDYAPSTFAMARIMRAMGKLPDAVGMLQKACNSADAKIEYFHELAGVLGAMGKFDLVQQVLFAAIRRFPTHGPTYSELGVILVQGEFTSQGIDILKKAVAFSPNDWRSLNNLGSALIKVGREQEALDYLVKAEKLVAKNPERLERTLLLIGEAQRHMGALDKARSTFNKALNINPNSGRAWHDLADVMKFTVESPEIGKMTAALALDEASLGKQDREMISFSLGKAYMDCADPKQAIAHLDQANALRRSDFAFDPIKKQGYDSKITCDRVRRIADYFPKELFDNLPEITDGASSSHAFIVGMPRSGSTLVEQILGSHPNTLPTGELRSFPKFKDELFGPVFPNQPEDRDKTGSKELLSKLWASYRDEVHDMFPPTNGTRVIIDKMLGNFSWAGLILLSVPGAKIIHCRRDPVDTCLSCYSKRFANLQVYTCNQTELGEFYRAYDDLMTHWRAILPKDRFIEVNYEDVVADIEPQSRRLIDFLGLPWNDVVLEFQNSSRSVRTASAAQVRQKLYQSSVERWKPYAPYIQPLLAALGIHPQDEDSL
ncbi:MAG: sulfotransferase [Rhodospirillales bacterium]|nr:sulfotransferase [Rhodospirillales bacterium]